MQKITPFLMFQGKCKPALDLYQKTFPDFELLEYAEYPDTGELKGQVQMATFSIKGQRIICNDSSIKHAFDFTPSFSLFIDCDDETEQDHYFNSLSKGGFTLMPLDNYGFSRRFAWVADPCGISWQINLP
ncbi:MAG TPA: VOC family protein [Bellilinea sp.]|nr:VOC family protein [Bellilinea sp.]